MAGAFLSEVILTFFLLMVVCAATDSNKSNQVCLAASVSFSCNFVYHNPCNMICLGCLTTLSVNPFSLVRLFCFVPCEFIIRILDVDISV